MANAIKSARHIVAFITIATSLRSGFFWLEAPRASTSGANHKGEFQTKVVHTSKLWLVGSQNNKLSGQWDFVSNDNAKEYEQEFEWSRSSESRVLVRTILLGISTEFLPTKLMKMNAMTQ